MYVCCIACAGNLCLHVYVCIHCHMYVFVCVCARAGATFTTSFSVCFSVMRCCITPPKSYGAKNDVSGYGVFLCVCDAGKTCRTSFSVRFSAIRRCITPSNNLHI